MNFNNIALNTHCDCLSGASTNILDTFVRKVRKSPELKDADFRNGIERNKFPSDENDCEELCGLHGISFEIWNELSSAQLTQKYLKSSDFAPMGRNNLCFIRFTETCGTLKHTPNQREGINHFHYDFYKEDTFTVKNLVLLKMTTVNSL